MTQSIKFLSKIENLKTGDIVYIDGGFGSKEKKENYIIVF